jgi:hypothetical protein
VLNEQIEPLIKKVLKTSHLPVKFRFVKTDFGTVPPQITNLRTHKTPEGQEAKSVIVDFDFVYLGDCNLEVSIMGIHSGVRWVGRKGGFAETQKSFEIFASNSSEISKCLDADASF